MDATDNNPAVVPRTETAHGALPVDVDRIREIAARINATLTEGEVLNNVATILAQEFHAPRAAVVMAEAGSRNPALAAGFKLGPEFESGWVDMAIGFPLAGVSILKARVCVIGDVDSDALLALEQRAWLRAHAVRAAWSVPLPSKSGAAMGAVVLMYAAPHRPDSHDSLMCQVYCQHAAMALENARLHDALRVQAIHDPKTALYTHDYLLESLRSELARADRADLPTALLMLDIDDYKAFNDAHGHLAGDRVLAELAAIIRDQVRDSDTPARFGGEEFSVLLPGTDLDEAREIAERIRTAIEAHRIDLGAGTPARVTISAGAAVQQGESTNPDRLIEAADSALYDSKRSGKNTVRVAAI